MFYGQISQNCTHTLGCIRILVSKNLVAFVWLDFSVKVSQDVLVLPDPKTSLPIPPISRIIHAIILGALVWKLVRLYYKLLADYHDFPVI